jgi:hypothetical protein
MRHVLAEIDEDLRPLTEAEVRARDARRQQIHERQRAKAAEAHLPIDERRQIVDLSELRAVAVEFATVLPFAALAVISWFAANIP